MQGAHLLVGTNDNNQSQKYMNEEPPPRHKASMVFAP